jgi:polar amino acid transport system substrate-binding protein
VSGIKQPLTYSGRSRGVGDARTVLLRNASKRAAAGQKPWTVQYLPDPAPIFLGLASGRIGLYFGPTLSLKYDATHVANTKSPGQISTTPVGFVTATGSPMAKTLAGRGRTAHRQRRRRQDLRQVGVGGIEITKPALNPPTSF